VIPADIFVRLMLNPTPSVTYSISLQRVGKLSNGARKNFPALPMILRRTHESVRAAFGQTERKIPSCNLDATGKKTFRLAGFSIVRIQNKKAGSYDNAGIYHDDFPLGFLTPRLNIGAVRKPLHAPAAYHYAEARDLTLAINSLTKYIGGHGNSLGGAVTDTGLFDSGSYRTSSNLIKRMKALSGACSRFAKKVCATWEARCLGRLRIVLRRAPKHSRSEWNAPAKTLAARPLL